MDTTGYVALTRQSGLMAEMRAVANNVANAATTGYRAEGVIFAEVVRATGRGTPSVSMAAARVGETDLSQGGLEQTRGPFDLAVEGEGFFLVETPQGPRLTRAGHFTPSAEGDLVAPDGARLLDAGGAPVFVPTGAGDVAIGPDGTISAGGQPLGQVGLVVPRDPLDLVREGSQRFDAPAGYDPAPAPRILQGFLEESNVDPVLEIARMIEVQRAYEMGQGFLEREDERVRGVIRALNA